MKEIIIIFLLTTISTIGYSQDSDSTKRQKVNFTTLSQINLTPSPTISLHLKKLPAYSFQSIYNTCNNKIDQRYLFTDNKELSIVHDLEYNYNNPTINCNSYNTVDPRTSLLAGALNLLFDALLDGK